MLTRRQLLSGAAAGLAGPMLFGGAASAADRRCRRKTLLVSDHFTGRALNSQLWNPYICDNPSNGWPWLMQNDVAVPSSAIGGPNSFNEDYDLPSYVQVSNGLTLRCQRGSAAPGYTFTGSVICSYPTDNDFGSGAIHTPGFTIAGGYVEVRAKMPDTRTGGWPAIWFLPAPGGAGVEIDLHEGGFVSGTTDPNHLMASNVHTGGGNRQFFTDTGVDLSAGFHTYGFEYRPGVSIKMYFDGGLVASYTTEIPSGPYYLILNNSVAGAAADSWHTVVGDSTPSSNDMLVSYVEVNTLS